MRRVEQEKNQEVGRGRMQLIDTHAHLTDARFESEGDRILANARKAGVDRIVVVADAMASSVQALELAERHSGTLWASAGVHPHNATQYESDTTQHLQELALRDHCVAIGEIGLDYYYDFTPPAVQQSVFATQLDLARALNRPVIIHCRDAYDDLLRLLQSHPLGSAGGVAHCFTGTQEQAWALLDRGLYLGMGGVITFKKADELRRVVRHLPLDRLVIETDAPYLAPAPYRGKLNEPAYVKIIAQRLAQELNISEQAVAEATTRNAMQLFWINER